jgi:integrator complex subunit 1
MSKLLACLDQAMASDRAAMSSAVVDKAYMAQLVEVQHLRGATGGHVFHDMLLANSEAQEKDKGTNSSVVNRKSKNLLILQRWMLN